MINQIPIRSPSRDDHLRTGLSEHRQQLYERGLRHRVGCQGFGGCSGRVNPLTRALVGGVIDDLVPDTPATGMQSAEPPTPSAEPITPNADGDKVFGSDNLPVANVARTASAGQRRQAQLVMRADLNGALVDALNKSEIARSRETSVRTVVSDLPALAQAGRLHLNGVVEKGVTRGERTNDRLGEI